MTDLYAEAARARAAANGVTRTALPLGETKREDVKFRTEFAEPTKVERNGQDFYQLDGYASMTERAYEMWDMFGPYHEVVSRSAFEDTLAANPMVVYRFNHAGTPMANTRNGRLELWADSTGLGDRAFVNPQRQDVQELVTAIRDQDVTEQSFMFSIDDGEWDEDFTEFRINRADLNRGDVGPVTYGANPFTLVASRSGEFLSVIDKMPVLVAREAMSRLALRGDLTVPVVGATTPAPITINFPGNAANFVQELKDFDRNAGPVKSATPEPPASVEPRGMSLELARAQLDMDKEKYRR